LENASLVVTSVLENFIVDVCKGVSDGAVQLFAHQQITAHVEDLHSLICRLPAVNVLIMPPLYRSEPVWFGAYLSDFTNFLSLEVGRLGSNRMAVCSPFLVVPSMLTEDGVHLSQPNGDLFMNHLDSALNTLLVDIVTEVPAPPGDPSDLTDQSAPDRLTEILDAVNRNSSQLESIGALGDSVAVLQRSSDTFEAYVRRRFKKDDYIFARMKEESDADVNKSREDRVVITGLVSPQVSTHAEKKQHFKETVTRLVALACVSADPLPMVLDVFVNIRKDRGQPLVEARLDSAAGAGLFRREGVKLAKANHAEFSNLYFANSVTQSTRVRIDILKELGKRLTTVTEVAYVQGFISRPVLQYRVRDGERSLAEGVGRSYTFVDAVAKFGSKLTPGDLSSAYLRAGDTFAGAMSQYFIVLSDDRVLNGPRTGANRTQVGSRGASRGRRGGRGGIQHRVKRTTPMEIDLSQSVPSPFITERGVKRPGEPSTDVPSKKQENESESSELSENELF
jgi:hypothetical protein